MTAIKLPLLNAKLWAIDARITTEDQQKIYLEPFQISNPTDTSFFTPATIRNGFLMEVLVEKSERTSKSTHKQQMYDLQS